MNCPHCKSANIRRSRRRGIWEDCKASMGLWPYSCDACGRRFNATRRQPPTRANECAPKPKQEAKPAHASGPEMAFRSDPVKPMAKVVIQADDQVQLDQILMALHRAVSYYQQPVRETARAGK